MMNMLCGLQAAHRNCVFFRLTSLTNWRNFPRACMASKRLPQVPGSPVGNQCQGQSPRKSPGLLCSLTGIPSSFRSCSSSQEQLLKTRCRGTWKGISRGSQWSHFSSMEGAAILTLSGFVPGKGFPVRGTDVVHSFHTSSRLWAAPAPLLWILLKPMQKLLAIIVGRGIRKWWQTLPPNKKELFKESIKKNKWKLFLGSSSLGILFIVFYFTHLEESPVTGRKKLLVLGKEQFMMLSQMEYDAWMEEFKDDFLPEKDPRYLAVKKVLQHLVESNSDIPGMSEFQWTIHMVDRPSVNAFVLPNGQVFVFTGLLEAVSDIHQLTFLLGHEIAHAVLGHAAEKASLVHLWDFLGLILLTMIWALCPRDSLAVLGQWIQSKLKEYVFDRPYSRTLEAEADTVGLQFAAKACVDVRACSVFWQQLEFADRILGEPRLPEWLSTHPSHENRAEHLERLIPQAIKIRESCKCPPLTGPDPRMLFRLRVKHFLEVTEEEDRNISAALVKKHKLDSLPIQKKETIPLTFMVDKRTGS